MFEFTDKEWEEIERGPFGDTIEKMSRVHSDLISMKDKEKNLFKGAQFFGMSRVVESAAILLYETQRRINGMEEYHRRELGDVLTQIVEVMSGRVEDLDQKAVDEIEADTREVRELLNKEKP